MSVCDTPGCPGGHHKFPSCIAEALWVASLDGADYTTGDTDFRGHHALMILTEAEDLVADGPRIVTVPAGCYIVTTASSGAVWLTDYGSPELAHEFFGYEREAYGLWLDETEG